MTTDFNGFGLPAKLLGALARMEFLTPTPIQAQTIPLGLEGRDVLGSAQTGTGKTAAFGLPLIVHLMNNPAATALILLPSRELATQVQAALIPMIPVPDIKTVLLIGGDSMFKQLNQLKVNQPRLIIGTPGRINDHLDRKSLKLDRTNFVVLDETDRMLDMGFGVQIDRILAHVSAKRQTLLFSATLPANIVKLSGKYMRDPVRVAVGSTTTPAANIRQELIQTTDEAKYGQLVEQLGKRTGSVIVFVKTKYGAERLSKKLNAAEHKTDALHGDLQQRRRERVTQNFRDMKYRILVATDVAARGLDIPHIEHVINYDLPQCPEDYIHRIGRTARAGAEGSAVNLLTPADGAKWRAIHRLIHGKDDPSIPTEAKKKGAAGGRKFGGGGGGGYKGRGGSFYKGKSAEGSSAPSGKSDGGFKKDFAKKDYAKKDFGKKPFSGKDGSSAKPAWKINKPRNKANFKMKKAG